MSDGNRPHTLSHADNSTVQGGRAEASIILCLDIKVDGWPPCLHHKLKCSTYIPASAFLAMKNKTMQNKNAEELRLEQSAAWNNKSSA